MMAKALTSLRLDERLVKRAQKVLGAKNRTQTIEMSLEAVVETEKHRKLIKRYSGKARPGDFDRSYSRDSRHIGLHRPDHVIVIVTR